jgi:hypothetical protein
VSGFSFTLEITNDKEEKFSMDGTWKCPDNYMKFHDELIKCLKKYADDQ